MKAWPPTFGVERKTCQEAKAQLLEMKKYFRIHDYTKIKKVVIVIYNLHERNEICWEYLWTIKEIRKIRISWSHFQRYFKEKYLSFQYYDNKRKEFHELKLEKKTMDEHAHKFL